MLLHRKLFGVFFLGGGGAVFGMRKVLVVIRYFPHASQFLHVKKDENRYHNLGIKPCMCLIIVNFLLNTAVKF